MGSAHLQTCLVTHVAEDLQWVILLDITCHLFINPALEHQLLMHHIVRVEHLKQTFQQTTLALPVWQLAARPSFCTRMQRQKAMGYRIRESLSVRSISRDSPSAW